MRNNKAKLVTFIALLAIYTVSLISIASAQSSGPVVPTSFYGKAEVNGREVPINSIIIAKIDGKVKGHTVVIKKGEYGDPTGSKGDLGIAGSVDDMRKETNFFVKLPGMKEIQATETFAWQPGQDMEFDLTFEGAEVKDPNYNQSKSALLGGGSTNEPTAISTEGGIATLSQDTKQVSFYYEEIKAGRQLRVTLRNTKIPVADLQIVLNNALQAVLLNIESIQKPAAVPAVKDAYGYLSIDADKLKEENIDVAIIRFKVPNSWFTSQGYDPEKVTLLRYNKGAWNELTTSYEGGDSLNHQYRAVTPGFSYFAIKGEKTSGIALNLESNDDQEAAKSVTERIRERENRRAAETDDNSEEKEESKITEKVTKTVKEGGPYIAGLIVLILVTISVLVYFFASKKAKKWG